MLEVYISKEIIKIKAKALAKENNEIYTSYEKLPRLHNSLMYVEIKGDIVINTFDKPCE